MEPREFSRRVDIRVYKDEPLSEEEWLADNVRISGEHDEADLAAYANYKRRFQPFRWAAIGANFEIVAHGESYFNEVGLLNAVNLLFGDDTTAYWVDMYGEDRRLNLLRYGKTDRTHQVSEIEGMSKDG